jgi:hypothetical protein
VPVVAGWDGLVPGSGASRALLVAGDLCLHVQQIDELLLAVQVELVDPGAGLLQCLAVGKGGVAGTGERFPDALQAPQGCLRAGQFGLSGVDHEPRGGGIEPGRASRLVLAGDGVLQPGDVLGGVSDAGYERVGADVQSRAAAVLAADRAADTASPIPVGEWGWGVVRAVRIWDQTASSGVWTRMERQSHRSGSSAGVCLRCRHT